MLFNLLMMLMAIVSGYKAAMGAYNDGGEYTPEMWMMVSIGFLLFVLISDSTKRILNAINNKK